MGFKNRFVVAMSVFLCSITMSLICLIALNIVYGIEDLYSYISHVDILKKCYIIMA